MTHDNPILIAGAGPTGLTAAVELVRRGKKIRIIETRKRRSVYSKALGVNPRTLELLEPSGVTKAMLKRGRKAPGVRAIYKGKELLSFCIAELDHRYNYMLILPQSESELLLEQALNKLGVKVEREITLENFKQNSDEVTGTLLRKGRKEAFHTPYLIGADGAHSIVRKTLKLNFPGEAMKGEWSLADVELENPLSRDWITGLIRDKGLYLQILIKDDLYRLASDKPGVLDNLPEGCKVKKIIWQTDFHVSHRQVEKYQVGRVFLAGDAAHIHSPLGGRGMNLGVEDACELAYRMAQGGLEDYSMVRHKKGASVIKMVKRQTIMFTSAKPGPRFMILYLLPLLLGIKPLKKRLLRVMAGVG